MPADDYLNEPAATTRTGLVTGISPGQRLSMAMRLANNDDPGDVPGPDDWGPRNTSPGVPNPYGRGLSAFEPNNIIFDAYRKAKGESDASQAAEAANQAQSLSIPGMESVLGEANGQIATVVQKAMDLARRAVPYVWGGTTANAVDCSGLLYYVFNAAGIKVPRYRATDWGRIGVAVTLAEARPGDVVYYDSGPNDRSDTDHVGLYIGNGLMVQAPQSGDHVRVTSVGKPTSIRRVFDDASFATIATPIGVTTSYNGSTYDPTRTAPISPTTGPVIPMPTSAINRSGVGFGSGQNQVRRA